MGFYLRKSFRAGPIRINLSTGGIGASIGVRGARVGVSSRGRAYFAGGAGGVFFRSSLSGRSSARRSSRSSAPAVPLQIETGVTFTPASLSIPTEVPADDILGAKPNHRLAAAIFGIPFATLVTVGVIATAGAYAEDPRWIEALVVSTIAAASVVWAVEVVRRSRRLIRRRSFTRALSTALRSPEGARELPRLVEEARATADDVAYCGRNAYLSHLIAAVSDRQLTDGELSRLSIIERSFALPGDFTRATRASAFRRAYLEAVGDHALDTTEEAALAHIRERLGIPDSELADETDNIARLAEIRAIRAGELPVIESSVKLRRDELCHFASEGRLVKQKVLRRFQEDGRRHEVQGLTIEKEGTLLITNKRLLLVHEGTTSIPHERILDVDLDLDRSLISILKDGAQKPVLFSTPDAQRASAILATAAQL
jgi:hypothetical protein